MEQGKWTHVLGKTWCLNLNVTIPVYLLNEREAILLDTGFAELDRPNLLAALEEKGLRPRAVLGSHSHNDHSGSSRYLQQLYGTEVILHQVEAAIVSDYSLMTVAYAPATIADSRRHFSELLLQADRTFRWEDGDVEIDGARFGVVPLPGHTPGHTGIITPDDVLYVGDAVLAEPVLKSAKLPSTRDWAEDIASKERIRAMRHSRYVLAHSGVYEDITALIDLNISDKLERAGQIAEQIRVHGPVTLDEAERLLWKTLDIHTRRFLMQVVFRRNVRCALDYLSETGTVKRTFRDGTEFFSVSDQ